MKDYFVNVTVATPRRTYYRTYIVTKQQDKGGAEGRVMKYVEKHFSSVSDIWFDDTKLIRNDSRGRSFVNTRTGKHYVSKEEARRI